MRTFKCPSCSLSFSEADKEWDLAIQNGCCLKCNKKNQKLSISGKPRNSTQSNDYFYPSGFKISLYLAAILIYLAFYILLRSSHAFVHYESIKECGNLPKVLAHCHRVEFRRIDITVINFIINAPIALIGGGLEIIYFPVTKAEGLYWQSQESRSVDYKHNPSFKRDYLR